MKTINLAPGFESGAVVAGCMRIANFDDKTADSFITGCTDAGVSFFDHADIYGRGKCEEVFGKALKRTKIKRGNLILQTKCGIVPGKMFDFSYSHIIESVEGSLARLQTDYIDILLLHRPDALMEPDEVARAFDELHSSGKVRYFGVSNQHPGQIALLKTAVKQPLIINQLQFSAAFTGMIDSGINVNMKNDASINRDGYIIEYARINNMTLQAWSPVQHGFFGGVFIGDTERFPGLNSELDSLAQKYDVTPSTIAYAFILRHPAKWQIVTGTTKPERIKEAVKAASLTMTREEWYRLYKSAGNKLP